MVKGFAELFVTLDVGFHASDGPAKEAVLSAYENKLRNLGNKVSSVGDQHERVRGVRGSLSNT